MSGHPPAARPDDPERQRRIMGLMPLVQALARRYANRGEPLDDLVQVGTIGLIKAVDRFDPSRGNSLVSFATPTILGEIRRHFRDRTWVVHVPRGAQEAHQRVNAVIDELTTRLGRSPSVTEIAAECGMDDEGVLDALAVGGAHGPASLSAHPDPEVEGEVDVPVEEPGFAHVEGRLVVARHLADLPERERRILVLRFREGMTQSQIAERIGISQMHVSRLIARSLATLRRGVGPSA